MTNYVLRRLLMALPTIFLVVTIVFIAVRVVPGDPAIVILGDHASQEALVALRERLGLDRPIWVQYLTYLRDVATGDFGRSQISGAPILPQIGAVVPFSVELAISGIAIGLIFGVPLGIVTAVRQNTWQDYVGRLVALVGISSPAFFLGIVLLLVFALGLGWFPVISASETGLAHLPTRLHNLVLPAFTIGLIEASFVTRLTRASFLEVARRPYMTTARSKGLSNEKVLTKHGLRNALIPVVTVMGTNLGALLGGAILTETVFSRPGLGELLLGAILQRDYNLVQAAVLTFALFVIFVNVLVDVLYAFIDPRISYS